MGDLKKSPAKAGLLAGILVFIVMSLISLGVGFLAISAVPRGSSHPLNQILLRGFCYVNVLCNPVSQVLSFLGGTRPLGNGFQTIASWQKYKSVMMRSTDLLFWVVLFFAVFRLRVKKGMPLLPSPRWFKVLGIGGAVIGCVLLAATFYVRNANLQNMPMYAPSSGLGEDAGIQKIEGLKQYLKEHSITTESNNQRTCSKSL